MPKSRHTSVIASPSKRRATKRRRSSITELAFHGIYTSRRAKAESVTHVSGTFCHLCLGPLNLLKQQNREPRMRAVQPGSNILFRPCPRNRQRAGIPSDRGRQG